MKRTIVASAVVVVAAALASGAPAALAPNTVGSAQIKNHSIQPIDLSTDVVNGSRCRWGPKTGQNYLFKEPFDAGQNRGFTAPSLLCLVPDRFEPNNSSAAATNLLGATEIYASVYPAGNDDWYTNTRAAQFIQVCPYYDGLGVYGGPLPTTVEMFKDGVPVTPTVGDCATYNNGSSETKQWAVHIDGPASAYVLRFSG